MRRVQPEKWSPNGVVRSNDNVLVVAGPGAGKTELLAQRACYLLETGICPAPKRILAISFKRDAAKNLAERVRKRCGDRARRFDSLTLDAFGKSLVDRFRCAIPEDWRPVAGYDVLVRTPPPLELREWFLSAPAPGGQTIPDFRGLSENETRLYFDLCAYGCELPYDGNHVKPLVRHYGLRWWQERLALRESQPSLSFPMLNRLAAYLLRLNPKITLALRATYLYVFMDEFQDTTPSQYDIVRTAFLGSVSTVTAVGDSKQRIMVWAGAMEDAFERFERDFSASRHHLVRNYRSVSELVRIQQVIAESIESKAPPAESVRTENVEDACSVIEFATPEQEADYLANLISDGVTKTQLLPRDFCVLARQQPGKMIAILKGAAARRDIHIRDESALRDLLAEPATEIIVALLRLATRTRDPQAWEFLTDEMARLRGLDADGGGRQLSLETRSLIDATKAEIASTTLDVESLPASLVGLIGKSTLRAGYRQYSKGRFLNETIKKVGKLVSDMYNGSMRDAVDEIIGVNIVPAMTVHKSKGLEFHTVIFMGLEDSQLWNFANQSEEEIRGFFVAFSRASHRVLFTFSDVRDERSGRRRQSKTKINDLYAILQSAGVSTIDAR